MSYYKHKTHIHDGNPYHAICGLYLYTLRATFAHFQLTYRETPLASVATRSTMRRAGGRDMRLRSGNDHRPVRIQASLLCWLVTRRR